MDDSGFAARLAECQAGIERELEILLGLEPKPGELARPTHLIEAMRYATLGGGKRLRPFLTVETARALGRTMSMVVTPFGLVVTALRPPPCAGLRWPA